MPWKTHVLYFVLTVTLKLCNGRTTDTEAFLQRRKETVSAHSPRFGTVQGNLYTRSVKHESTTPTPNGLLTLKLDNQKPSTVLHSSLDAKLKRMDPSVHCGHNMMTLKVKQPRALNFLVDSDERPLIPLSQMPSHCGFSVKRSRRDVFYSAPYQGCDVTQKGGNYVLPLRLLGAPMTMSCPVVSPIPSITCFPFGMVLKIGVSGTWKPISLVCGSCGIAVEVLSEGLTLSAPYHEGLCIEMKGEEYLLSLLLKDVELLVTCPLLPSVKPTTATTTPTKETTTPFSNSGQFLQYPYPQFPLFEQYPMFPGPSPQTQNPTAPTDAPSPQQPKLPSGGAAGSDTKNQEVPAAQHPPFQFMPQYSQFLQRHLFPKPVPPTQSTATIPTAAPPAQLPQMPQSPQYPFYFPPQFPMVPGIFHATTPPPPDASTEHDGKPNSPNQPQFAVVPPYSFLSFPKRPVPKDDQSQTVQEPKPHMYPQPYQIPMIYPLPKYPPQKQNTQSQTVAPSITSEGTATTNLKPALRKPFYYPYPYM
ncbi:extensin-like [Scomber scombrus]|uniref:Extensin-like n=1 Tax=Scomber scombrus TaxID=13677 RepID=A0AAV1N8K7_SCOSC